MKKKAAVFLDRDGTLNFDPGYLCKAEQFRFLPRVRPAMKLLAQAGLELFVISNQSGIARGLITQEQLDQIHARMTGQMKKWGVRISGIYTCPHSPEAGCACRKPSPRLVLKATRVHHLDLFNSYIVGDKWTDVETGVRAGLQTVLLANGMAKANGGVLRPDYVCKDLLDAARWIVQRHKLLQEDAAQAMRRVA